MMVAGGQNRHAMPPQPPPPAVPAPIAPEAGRHAAVPRRASARCCRPSRPASCPPGSALPSEARAGGDASASRSARCATRSTNWWPNTSWSAARAAAPSSRRTTPTASCSSSSTSSAATACARCRWSSCSSFERTRLDDEAAAALAVRPGEPVLQDREPPACCRAARWCTTGSTLPASLFKGLTEKRLRERPSTIYHLYQIGVRHHRRARAGAAARGRRPTAPRRACSVSRPGSRCCRCAAPR